MGMTFRDRDISLNLEGKHISGYVLDGPRNVHSVLHFERCNVHLFNGTIDGSLGGARNEHDHCVRFLNCGSVVMEDIDLIGGTGDGVYISHDLPGQSSGMDGRGTRNLTMRRVRGRSNNIGRNFISIVCGRTLLFEDVYSTSWTRSGMPGAVDLEPDWPNEYIDDVMVRRGSFEAGAGGALAGIMVYNKIARAPITRVFTEDCVVSGPFDAGLALVGAGNQNEEISHFRPVVQGARQNVVEKDGRMTIVSPNFQGGDDDCKKRCRKKDDRDARRRCLKRCQ